MPELPEVETTRRGISAALGRRTVKSIAIHERRFRQPIPAGLERQLQGARLGDIERRAKYLLFNFGPGTLLVHLGMSGSLRVVPCASERMPHDHVEIVFGPKHCLRFRDPRRFGLMLWCEDDPLHHPLLAKLGPEPLSSNFDGAYLHTLARGRKLAVKNFVMDAHVVVGVGNIYASEALFRAGIHPARAAGKVSRARFSNLVGHIKDVLSEAIDAGGTTLRDFVRNDGEPGYFRHDLKVYGREGHPCVTCGLPIANRTIGQRSSFFCRRCQR